MNESGQPEAALARQVPATGYGTMANAIRALAMDAVETAKSGHPGMPMGMADVATVLFAEHLVFDPAAPRWPDRDRFVLSAGHGSMLLYALMYLTGYPDLTLQDLKNFRQLGSGTAGHPEYGAFAGIETTTGPLGQGLANGVGMALAERMQAARYGAGVVDHHTYVIAGDGCLMEGISQEAISLAGHLRLAKLTVLFDDNHISIDGPTGLSTSDDHGARFRASGWDVSAVDGHDAAAVSDAITSVRESDRPSLIMCRTTIAQGAPTKAGTAASHGAPLGAEEVTGTRAALGWAAPPFEVPSDILDAWRALGTRGAAAHAAWRKRLDALPERDEFERTLAGRPPEALDGAIAAYKQSLTAEKPARATRQSSGEVLELLAGAMPEMVGGSADLTGSNNTKAKVQAVVGRDGFGGGYIHYGVREHAMGAVMNGLALHGGLIPYGGTFLVFADYARPAIRLSALMGLRVVYVMTHDSIGLGEDGPTHQPVEHLASLRAMPGLRVFRPADAVEVLECWALAIEAATGPSVIALTRQKVLAVRTEPVTENLCARGAYELVSASGGAARATLFATGSEVELALAARGILEADGTPTRVVSVPCWELFADQPEDYRARILGVGTVRVAIEAAVSLGWERFVGADGGFVGMSSFGASAPAPTLFEHFQITPQAVVEAVRARLG
jgi:transketolase